MTAHQHQHRSAERRAGEARKAVIAPHTNAGHKFQEPRPKSSRRVLARGFSASGLFFPAGCIDLDSIAEFRSRMAAGETSGQAAANLTATVQISRQARSDLSPRIHLSSPFVESRSNADQHSDGAITRVQEPFAYGARDE